MSQIKDAISHPSLRAERSKLRHKEAPMTKLKEAISRNSTNSTNSTNCNEGLPKEAFAIVGDPKDPETWKLPHHTKAILRSRGRLDIEKLVLERSEGTVDWDRMPAAVAALSPGGHRGERVQASEEDIIQAARHLAHHYQAAGNPVPDTLGALI